MRRKLTVFAHIGAIIVFGAASAAADDCACRGTLENAYRGGDKLRLYWTFETFVDTPASPYQDILICYHKKLENNSSIEIRNIRWEPAEYFPAPMPAGSVSSACSTLPGVMNLSTKSGPLYFGISSHAFDTTVREPKAGWKAHSVNSIVYRSFQVAQVSPNVTDVTQTQNDESKTNTVTYPDVRSEFYNSNFKISILSQAVTEGPITRISIEVENKGDASVRVTSELSSLSGVIRPNSSIKQSTSYPKFVARVGVAQFSVGVGLGGFFSASNVTAGIYLAPDERRGLTE
jgi:hypothetical protein